MGNMKEIDHAEDLFVSGRIISERILGKFGGNVWTRCIWLRIWTSEHGNEPSGSIKRG
jgi:hypothetical protein